MINIISVNNNNNYYVQYSKKSYWACVEGTRVMPTNCDFNIFSLTHFYLAKKALFWCSDGLH